jgi:hypothetical protein
MKTFQILGEKYTATHKMISRKGVTYDLTAITEAQAEQLIKDGCKTLSKVETEAKAKASDKK